jgi:hypothetical protein
MLVKKKKKRSKKEKKEDALRKKLNKIRRIGCICPGCGHDFSSCDDKALHIVFERCHYHSRKCFRRLKNDVFYACMVCNMKQKDVCGYWESPGKLKRIC